MIIMTIIPHMPGQSVYPVGEQGYLNLCGAGISDVLLKLLGNVQFLFLIQNIYIPPQSIFRQPSISSNLSQGIIA